MSGMGLDLALFARHPDANPEALRAAQKNTVKFLSGELNLDGLTGEKRVYEIAEETVAILKAGGAVGMVMRSERPSPTVLRIEIDTVNSRAGHPFPIGPFDLNEVWQEVRVLDRDGVEVFAVGGLDADLRVDENGQSWDFSKAAHRARARRRLGV